MATGGAEGGHLWMDSIPESNHDMPGADWINSAHLRTLDYGNPESMESEALLLEDPDNLDFDQFVNGEDLFDFPGLDAVPGQGGLGGPGLEELPGNIVLPQHDGGIPMPTQHQLEFDSFDVLPDIDMATLHSAPVGELPGMHSLLPQTPQVFGLHAGVQQYGFDLPQHPMGLPSVPQHQQQNPGIPMAQHHHQLPLLPGNSLTPQTSSLPVDTLASQLHMQGLEDDGPHGRRGVRRGTHPMSAYSASSYGRAGAPGNLNRMDAPAGAPSYLQARGPMPLLQPPQQQPTLSWTSSDGLLADRDSPQAELTRIGVAHQSYLTPLSKRKGKGGRQPAPDPRTDPGVDPRKARRIMANRMSAAKSKAKQKAVSESLRNRVANLRTMKAQVEDKVRKSEEECAKREKTNDVLAKRIQEYKHSFAFLQGGSTSSQNVPGGPGPVGGQLAHPQPPHQPQPYTHHGAQVPLAV